MQAMMKGFTTGEECRSTLIPMISTQYVRVASLTAVWNQALECNCDQTDDTIDAFFQDDGYLEYKDHLPVTVFKAGDTGTVFSFTGTNWHILF